MKDIMKRFKSPVLWVSVIGLIYATVLVPNYPQLPDWTAIVGYLCTIFGIANNPCDSGHF